MSSGQRPRDSESLKRRWYVGRTHVWGGASSMSGSMFAEAPVCENATGGLVPKVAVDVRASPTWIRANLRTCEPANLSPCELEAFQVTSEVRICQGGKEARRVVSWRVGEFAAAGLPGAVPLRCERSARVSPRRDGTGGWESCKRNSPRRPAHRLQSNPSHLTHVAAQVLWRFPRDARSAGCFIREEVLV